MAYSLEQFVADTNAALARDSGPAGREEVRRGLERLLAEQEFVDHVQALEIPGGAHVLHKDETHGYLILAHASRGDHGRAPHNHGRSWAIYGQVTNHTDVTEWERDKSAENAPLRVAKSYRLSPGEAGIYQDGAIHSVTNSAGTRIIRITGTDLDTIDREGFDPTTGEVRNLKVAS